MGKLKFLLIFLTVFIGWICGSYGNTVLETNILPEQNVMPALSNGHLGFEVYGTSIYKNGLYNGPHGNSHRARIPNFSNLQFPQCTRESNINCRYRMNISNGVFETIYEIPDYRITQQVYPHRFFNRAIINKVSVTRLLSRQPISINLNINEGDVTTDLFIEKTDLTIIRGSTVLKRFYTTRVVEDIRYQYEPSKLYVAYTQPTRLDLPINVNTAEFTHIVTIGRSEQEIIKEMDDILNSTNVMESHSREWENFWKNFNVSVDGNENLNQIIQSSIFYLVSNLPSLNSNQPNGRFYGLSPSGLAKPHYQGHSFWDTEIWMHPPILFMEPKWSADLLNYRYHSRQALENNAVEIGYSGYRYPWESGKTGSEVTDFCCPEIAMFQHHITADVAFAYRSHLAATYDKDWFENYGCEIAYNTAKFWASRVSVNATTKLLDINNVMGPDEYHPAISNNAYTNVIAATNILFGEFAGCVCEDQLKVSKRTLRRLTKIARNITLIYDERKNYHPQFDGYEIGSDIKQADTVLLGYPLQFKMDPKTKKNNLEIYEDATVSDGPAMTWAMHTIGFLDLKDYEKAEKLFKKSYEDYIRTPFLNWYEVAKGHTGAENFITGAGGFLQAIMNGYAGIRLHFDSLNITNFKMPLSTKGLHLKGIAYMNNRFNLDVFENSANLSFHKISDEKKIELLIDGKEMEVKINMNYTIKVNSTATLRPKKYPFGECMLKETVLGAATKFKIEKILILLLILIKMFI